MYRQSSGSYIQLGVASFYSGFGCSTGNPSGFSRLRNYVDWIKSTSDASSSRVSQFTMTLLSLLIFITRSGY